jgi:CP family cyanate transporter-like MFS transporter
VSIPATYALVAALGWRATAALLGAAVIAVGWLVAGVALAAAPPPRRAERAGAPARALALAPRFLLFSAAVLALFAALEAVQVHRLARFSEAGFDAATLATWAAAATLVGLPARFLVPRLANRLPAASVLLAFVVLLVPACALGVRGASEWEMIGHFLLFGALFGATIPMRTVVMGDWFGGPSFGALMGLQSFAIALGRAGGPASAGWLRQATGDYTASMLVLTCLVTLAALLVWASRRAPARRQSSPGSGR